MWWCRWLVLASVWWEDAERVLCSMRHWKKKEVAVLQGLSMAFGAGDINRRLRQRVTSMRGENFVENPQPWYPSRVDMGGDGGGKESRNEIDGVVIR